MLRPGHRLLGGCHIDGDTAVRRGRLRTSRKVILLREQEPQEEKQREGQAARLSLKCH